MVDVPSPEKLARIVRWIIFAFIAYVFLSNYLGWQKPTTTSTTQTASKEKDCGKEPNSLKDFSLFAIPVMPTFSPALRVQDTTVGTGEPAQCGQHVTLRYSYTTSDGQVIFSNMDAKQKPETITIGAEELLPGAEHNIIGLKAGGVRAIGLSAPLAFAGVKDIHTLKDNAEFNLPKAPPLKNLNVLAELSVISLSPAAPLSALPLRVIDRKFGNGTPIYCGDKVRADITIWKLDGTKLFSTADSAPVQFTLGRSQVAFGIEQAILGMTVGAKRSLILPPAYNHPLEETKSQDAIIPQNIFPASEIVLVEIELLPALEETPAPIPLKTPVTEPAKK